MEKVIKRSSLRIKQIREPTVINPKVLRLIEKITKKYDGVWRDLAKL